MLRKNHRGPSVNKYNLSFLPKIPHTQAFGHFATPIISLRVSSYTQKSFLMVSFIAQTNMVAEVEFNSAIHKAAGLTVPGRSTGLPGTIPPFQP